VVKVLAYILTAAAVVIGADVFVMSSDATEPVDSISSKEAPISLHGGTGMPTPPPDAF
jgi:hypothetical protein